MQTRPIEAKQSDLYLGQHPRLAVLPRPPVRYFHNCREHWKTATQIAFLDFDVIGKLGNDKVTFAEFRDRLGLKCDRPAMVFAAVLLADEFLQGDVRDRLSVHPNAHMFLDSNSEHYIGDYINLGANNPNAVEFIQRLKTDSPRNEGGIAFIHGEKVEDSSMTDAEGALKFTKSLEGRAKIVAPYLSRAMRLNASDSGTLWDIGCGSGVYTASILQDTRNLEAVCIDSKPVLEYAEQQLKKYGVRDRVKFIPGDMFTMELPSNPPQHILLSNVLHDWDSQECYFLINRLADALRPGGELTIHDVLLGRPESNIIDPYTPYYGIDLFSFTYGRAYYFHEFEDMLEQAGLRIAHRPVRTAIDCWAITAVKDELALNREHI